MITRLRIKGFKNIVDSEFHFGPFNCIAGLNGVGKSNLFDAIMFLSALADKPFVEAAKGVRGGENALGLRCVGAPGFIEFDADIIIPESGVDDFNQKAIAGFTYLNYQLRLEVKAVVEDGYSVTRIQLVSENLKGYPQSHAVRNLKFKYSRDWLRSVVKSAKTSDTFIYTEDGRVFLPSDRMLKDNKKVRGGGKAMPFSIETLPRTVLSSAQNADENRTAVLVRREMRSWRQLQLEPSALRGTDDFDSPRNVDRWGAHIPGTLYKLATQNDADRVYFTLANRLAQLVEGVKGVSVDRDDSRNVFRFMLEDEEGLILPAGALSDGTLRFVALSIIEQDSSESGLICFEEPENGIHPQRVDAMLQLLYDIASDCNFAVDERNPLRQMIITTHSPLVAYKVARDDLFFVESRFVREGQKRVASVSLLAVAGSWRCEYYSPISKSGISRYLTGEAFIKPMVRNQPTLWDDYQLRLDLKEK